MPYDNKTIEEIKLLIQDSLTERFNENLKILPKSFIKILAAIIAGVFIILFKQIGWLFLQLFPDYAYWGEVNILGTKVRPLLELGNLMGVGYPFIGTQFKGNITVQITQPGKFLEGGTQLKSPLSGKIYLVLDTTLLEDENVLIPIICTTNGTAGNLDIGETIEFVSSLSMVKRTATIFNVIQVAKDDETENEYRRRVSQRFKTPPMGGALNDYRTWANEVSGVWNSYPQKDEATPAGVLIWVAGNPDYYPNRVPDNDLLKRVGDSCTYDPITKKATRKPVAAILDPAFDGSYSNIHAISVIFFSVIVYGLTGVEIADFYDILKNALDEYFLSREPYIRGLSDDNNKTNVISKNSISSVVYQAASTVKAEFDRVGLIFNGEEIFSQTLTVGQLAEMETLTILNELDEFDLGDGL